MKSIIQQIISVIIFLVMIGGVYYASIYTDALNIKTYKKAKEVDQWAREIDGEIIANLRAVESIRFDASVLQSDTYTSLIDTRVDIVEQEVSRSNPFDPIETTIQSQ